MIERMTFLFCGEFTMVVCICAVEYVWCVCLCICEALPVSLSVFVWVSLNTLSFCSFLCWTQRTYTLLWNRLFTKFQTTEWTYLYAIFSLLFFIFWIVWIESYWNQILSIDFHISVWKNINGKNYKNDKFHSILVDSFNSF